MELPLGADFVENRRPGQAWHILRPADISIYTIRVRPIYSLNKLLLQSVLRKPLGIYSGVLPLLYEPFLDDITHFDLILD